MDQINDCFKATEFVIQNRKDDNPFQGHISGAEANLKGEDGSCTLDHFWLGIMCRHDVTANWYFPMPLSLSETSLRFYKFSFLIIIRIVEPINVLW